MYIYIIYVCIYVYVYIYIYMHTLCGVRAKGVKGQPRDEVLPVPHPAVPECVLLRHQNQSRLLVSDYKPAPPPLYTVQDDPEMSPEKATYTTTTQITTIAAAATTTRLCELTPPSWPAHDIVITNIVWCIAYKQEVGSGVVYGPIIVQSYCNRVGNADRRGNERVVDSCTTASKKKNIL